MAVKIPEDWIEARRYLNMEMLREQRKAPLLEVADGTPEAIELPNNERLAAPKILKGFS